MIQGYLWKMYVVNFGEECIMVKAGEAIAKIIDSLCFCYLARRRAKLLLYEPRPWRGEELCYYNESLAGGEELVRFMMVAPCVLYNNRLYAWVIEIGASPRIYALCNSGWQPMGVDVCVNCRGFLKGFIQSFISVMT